MILLSYFLTGITQRCSYLKKLGVKGVWLSPFYKSPMVDNGYDVQDYTEIDPVFGNLDDFKELISTLKTNDIKLIVDFVPNHTSDQHEWFKKSSLNIEPFNDYYIWKKGQSNKPPTNWVIMLI